MRNILQGSQGESVIMIIIAMGSHVEYCQNCPEWDGSRGLYLGAEKQAKDFSIVSHGPSSRPHLQYSCPGT